MGAYGRGHTCYATCQHAITLPSWSCRCHYRLDSMRRLSTVPDYLMFFILLCSRALFTTLAPRTHQHAAAHTRSLWSYCLLSSFFDGLVDALYLVRVTPLPNVAAHAALYLADAATHSDAALYTTHCCSTVTRCTFRGSACNRADHLRGSWRANASRYWRVCARHRAPATRHTPRVWCILFFACRTPRNLSGFLLGPSQTARCCTAPSAFKRCG